MSAAHLYEIQVHVDGKVLLERSGKGRANRDAEMRKLMIEMDALQVSGEIWYTESLAKKWAVWGYRCGGKNAAFLRSEIKA